MHWIDWLITIVPVLFVLGLAIYCRKYIRGVADYLAAGRVAGRYVMCVAGLDATMGVIFMVAMCEAKYQTGFAMDFWAKASVPVFVIMGLTGYCFYRFRETKALTLGQFLEMRYSRSFRIFAATVRTVAEMLANAIAPAIAANFFIYYLGLHHKYVVLGVTIPTFAFIIGVVLIMAMVVMWFGGRLALMVVDCMQGLMSYPIFVLIVAYVLWHFSWGSQIAPTMADRAVGESFLNPMKMENMRDFNLFSVAVGIVGSIIGVAVWAGNDGGNAGRTPHEQKMAGILATWRGGFSGLMPLVVAIVVITFMCHRDFATQAKEVRIDLTRQVADEVAPEKQDALVKQAEAIPVPDHKIGVDKPYSRDENADTPYLNAAHDILGHDAQGNDKSNRFKTAYHAMMMPLTLRKLLPTGMIGLFCLLMLMLMLATDTSRMFNSSSTLIQDIVMPLRKTPLTPEQHVRWLRFGSLGVGVFFFFYSLAFNQRDFIWMYVSIMVSIWIGGAGPVMVGGLYTRFGNTVGAYASVIVGSSISGGAAILQFTWAGHVYPFLDRLGWIPGISAFLEWVTRHTAPYVVWHMSTDKFPINSIEIGFVGMILGITAYVVGSLLTQRTPYNLERMLHRGQYNTDGTGAQQSEPSTRTTASGNLALNVFLPLAIWVIGVVLWNTLSRWPIHGWRAWTGVSIVAAMSICAWAYRSWLWTKVVRPLLGITPECTRGDKILIWSVFLYSIVYNVGICFVLVVIWNVISPWPNEWWSHYFYVTSLLVGAGIGVISTVWFLIGGVIDTRRLFRDLAARVDNPLDDGRVQGHVSVMDVEKLGTDAGDAGQVGAPKE